MSEFDIEKYTRKRMQQLRGEDAAHETIDPLVDEYTSRRIRELRLEEEMRKRKINLDNASRLGYTVATMNALVFEEE